MKHVLSKSTPRTGKIRQLADRYATPLPQITEKLAVLTPRVEGHLTKMAAKL